MAVSQAPRRKTSRPRVAEKTRKDREDIWRQVRRFCDAPELDNETRKKRRQLERNTPRWLKHFFPEIFRRPWGDVHRQIIAAADYTIAHGGRFVVAAPRGTGKSFVLAGCCLKAVLDGRRRFPVLMPWDSKALKKALKFWHTALCFNERLHSYYPEYTYPFVHSRGTSQNIVTLVHSNNKPIGAKILMSEGMLVLPDSRGVIGGTTLNGNPLGMNYTLLDGTGIRPDLGMIDDPQDRETATSRAQILSTIELIDKDISGMAGPDVDMPLLMACTVKQKGDVAEHYLEKGGDWRSQKASQIVTWPENRELWDEWNTIRLDGHDAQDGGKAGLAHYRKHKKALRKGCTVSWRSRHTPEQPDAIYSAMLDFYVLGEDAFLAERQNEPRDAATSLYDLEPRNVTSHMVDTESSVLPSGYHVFVGHTDINRTGLHYCLAGFAQDMTAHVPLYGKVPDRGELWAKNAPELERKQAIFRGLRELCERIEQQLFKMDTRQMKPSTLLVDRGYEPDVVHKFCAAARYSFRVIPARGYAAHKYYVRRTTLIGRPWEGCHIVKSDFGPFMSFNADLWRETAQRAFLADVGAPGGITLYRGRTKNFHETFAEHIVAEKLINKYQTDAGLRWEWTIKPGNPNDLLDALTGCYVAAAAAGLSPSGMPRSKPKRRKETRKAKVGLPE